MTPEPLNAAGFAACVLLALVFAWRAYRGRA